jgi:hypothetical protein
MGLEGGFKRVEHFVSLGTNPLILFFISPSARSWLAIIL